MNKIISAPLTLAAGGLSATAGWVTLHHYYPSIPAIIFDLLTLHPWLTGIWLGLTVIGLDAALVAARDAIGYKNVGQKARAHWRLSGGRD